MMHFVTHRMSAGALLGAVAVMLLVAPQVVTAGPLSMVGVATTAGGGPVADGVYAISVSFYFL